MRSTTLSAVLLAITLLHAPARADEGSESEARALFAQGNEHIRDHDYPGALALFQRAYALFPNVKILLNIGTMLRQLGRNAEAATAYEAYLRDSASDPGKKEEVERLLADLDTRVAKLRVTVDDITARVRVDGKLAARSGLAVVIRVEPGPHTVSAERDGAAPVAASVTAVAGEEARLSLQMTPPRPALLPSSPIDLRTRAGVPVWAWVAGGTGVALGIAGVVFRADWGAVDGKQEAAGCGASLTSCPRSYTGLEADNARKDRDRGLFVGLGTAALLGIGAGLVGVGIYGFRSASGKNGEPSSASVRAVPWLGGGVAGAALEGRL